MIDWIIIGVTLLIGFAILGGGIAYAVNRDEDIGIAIGYIGLTIISIGMIMVAINVLIYIGVAIVSAM